MEEQRERIEGPWRDGEPLPLTGLVPEERVIHYKDRTVLEMRLRTGIAMKPLVTPKRLTMDFNGAQHEEPPRVDDFLQPSSPKRKVFAYHIAQVREVKRKSAGPRRFVLMCWPTDEQMMNKRSPEQRVFVFHWWPRKKKAAE